VRELKNWEKKIFFDRRSIGSKVASFIKELLGLLLSGKLPAGYHLPSVDQIAKITGLSASSVTRVLNALAKLGYLKRKNGQISVVIDPANPDSIIVDDADLCYYNTVSVKSSHITSELASLFESIAKRNFNKISSDKKKLLFSDLNSTICDLINESRNGNYIVANVFYLHDYYAMLRSVAIYLSRDKGAIVIPSNASTVIRNKFDLPSITLIELPYDEDGFKMSDLAAICKRQQVSAVYLTPCLTIYTPADVAKIIRLQRKHQFKLVIDDRHSPWLAGSKVMLLDAWTEIIDAIIYIEPLSYLISNLDRFNIVTANAEIIKEIREIAEKDGIHAYFPEAFATNYVISSKIFKKTNIAVKEAIGALKAELNAVFYKDNFWEAQPERLSNTPSFCIRPKNHYFPAAIFEKLKTSHLYIVNPETEHPGVTPILAIWIELGNQIGSKNLRPQFVVMEKLLRKLMMDFRTGIK